VSHLLRAAGGPTRTSRDTRARRVTPPAPVPARGRDFCDRPPRTRPRARRMIWGAADRGRFVPRRAGWGGTDW